MFVEVIAFSFRSPDQSLTLPTVCAEGPSNFSDQRSTYSDVFKQSFSLIMANGKTEGYEFKSLFKLFVLIPEQHCEMMALSHLEI